LPLLLKKLHKLPKTAEILKSVVDTDFTFAIGKINWVVNNFQQRNVRLKKWQLIELACIYRFKDIPIIKEMIEKVISIQNIDLNIKLLA